jgi:molecular chaperone DnaK
MLKKEPSRGLNPDECVALGACIQGGKLGGNLPSSSAANDIILMDVTPLSLSIETVGGIATRLIDRNTTIPARKSQIFTTAANFQTSVDIKVLQGERHFARDNKLIGNFRLTGIKRARAGVPQIEVTFDIDVNGIVKVSATDLGTGKAQEITITSSSNMSEEEIQEAIRNAARFASEDQAVKEAADLVNEAESLCYRAETALKEKKKELDGATKSQIKKDIASLRRLTHAAKPERMTPQLKEDIKWAREALERSASGIL